MGMDRTLFFHFAVVNSMYCMWVLCVVVNGFILHMKAPWFESRIGYKSTLRAPQAQINGNVVPGGAANLLIHIFSFLAVVLSGNHLWVKIRMHPDFLKARATLCLHTETQSGTPNHPGTSMRLI